MQNPESRQSGNISGSGERSAKEGTRMRNQFTRAWLLAGLFAAGAAGGALAARFRDVPDNHWARAAIERSVDRKILDAPGGKFEPERPVTRAELAVVLV